MTIFDLLFIVAFLSLVIALVVAALQAIRGRRGRARAIVRRIGATTATYFAVVAVVSIGTPRQVISRGGAQCFDDWCITAVGVEHQHAGASDSLRVLLRLSSTARGIAQGERDVRVYVIDDQNQQYAPIAEPDALPLSASIPPEGAVTPSRLFVLPPDAGHPMLIVVHDWFPHCCIIADRESLLHRRTVVPLY
jgi:hypothetical protein